MFRDEHTVYACGWAADGQTGKISKVAHPVGFQFIFKTPDGIILSFFIVCCSLCYLILSYFYNGNLGLRDMLINININ